MGKDKKSKKNKYEVFSFWALDAATQKDIVSRVEGKAKGSYLQSTHVNAIFKNANVLERSVAYLDAWLDVDVPALVYAAKREKKKDKKDALMGELYLAFDRYASQYVRYKTENKKHLLKHAHKKIEKVMSWIAVLNEPGTPQDQVLHALDDSERCTHFCAKNLVSPFAEVLTASTDPDDSLKVLSLINERRLYWVWGGSMIRAILVYLPEYLYRSAEASNELGALFPVTGSLSYMLYALRGGLLWSGVLRHGLKGPWMKKEEFDVDLTSDERWQLYWQPAKLAVLNDTIWGPANLVCFLFYLKGGGLPFWADLLTAGLLIMDASFMLWQLREEEQAHQAELARFDQEIRDLEGNHLAQQHVIHQRHQFNLEWKYKYMKVILDLVYALSLLAAFLILCACFSPAGPAALLLLAAVGSALCFTLNLAYSTAKATVDIFKSQALRDEAQRAGLTSEVAYQEKMIHYQTHQLIRATLTDLLIPPLVIGSLVLLPLGIGLPVLAFGLALLATLYFISKSYEPSRGEDPQLMKSPYVQG